MDRERKLLYTVMVLAVIENALLLPTFINRSDLFAREAKMESIRECETKLIRIYKACLPKLHPVPRRGISEHGGDRENLGL